VARRSPPPISHAGLEDRHDHGCRDIGSAGVRLSPDLADLRAEDQESINVDFYLNAVKDCHPDVLAD
jgi:hypothetical protein